MQSLSDLLVTCLSAFFVGKAHLLDEKTGWGGCVPVGAEVSQSGPELIHIQHSASVWRGGRVGPE